MRPRLVVAGTVEIVSHNIAESLLVGDLAEMAGQNFLQVTPESLQGFYDYVPVDGTLPVDRFAQANLWKEILAGMRNYPQIAQMYDIGKIFAWLAQLAGLKNINQFKVQMADPMMLQQQAQQGNVVPMAAGGAAAGAPGGVTPPPGAPPASIANLNEPGQIPNVGPTG